MAGLVVETFELRSKDSRGWLSPHEALVVDTIGGCGPTREADAGRGAGAPDALLGWEFLCREVSK